VKTERPTGMLGFTIVCVGQAVSLLGTAMTGFGLTLWAYQITGKATPLALIGLCWGLPYVALSPFVGVLVDRGSRKLMMMLSDLSAAGTTLIVAILYATDSLQIWHLYLTAAISGIFQGFQWPAYSAAMSVMLPKEQYTRANGMLGAVGSGSGILGPMLAGALIGPLRLTGLLGIDLLSAVVAVGTLLLVHIPQPASSETGRRGRGSFLQEAAYGFRYILDRPTLLGLQSVFMVGNFFLNLAFVLLSPMILGRTGSDELVLGSVRSAGAIGGLMGGLLMAAWGGPKRRVKGVLMGWSCIGVLGCTVVGLGQALPVWVSGTFLANVFGAMIDSSNQAIWQAKVPPEVQGRVFSVRRLIALLIAPVSQVLAGPLADWVLEPAMAEDGRLVSLFGWLVGTGTGAGMALLFLFCGLLVTMAGLSGYLIPATRNVEHVLPDHDAAVDGSHRPVEA
jgi:DHA3 family macrolide efflux protein-like MFS transporter